MESEPAELRVEMKEEKKPLQKCKQRRLQNTASRTRFIQQITEHLLRARPWDLE